MLNGSLQLTLQGMLHITLTRRPNKLLEVVVTGILKEKLNLIFKNTVSNPTSSIKHIPIRLMFNIF